MGKKKPKLKTPSTPMQNYNESKYAVFHEGNTWLITSEDDTPEQRAIDAYKVMSNFIQDAYLNKTWNIEVDSNLSEIVNRSTSKIFNQNLIKECLDKIPISIRRIRRRMNENEYAQIRLYTTDANILFIFWARKPKISKTEFACVMAVTNAANETEISSMHLTLVDDQVMIIPFSNVFVLISPKKNCKRNIEKNQIGWAVANHQYSNADVLYIYSGLNHILRCLELNIEPDFPFHTEGEMIMYRELTKWMTPLEPCIVTKMKVLTLNGAPIDKTYYDREFDLSTTVPEIVRPGDDQSSYPRVEFSENEYRYVDRYWRSRTIDGQRIDIRPYFMNAKLPVFCLPYEFESGEEAIFTVSYGIDLDKDLLRVTFTEHSKDKKHSLNLTSYFRDLKNFNIFCNILYMEIDLMVETVDDMLNSYPCEGEFSGLLWADRTELFELFGMVFGIYMTIYDRPQRTKILRVTELINSKPRAVSKAHEEPEFVVYKILKPAKEAKEMIERSIAIGGSRREAQYIMEDWPRRGGTRTLKDGRVIPFRETICHRHLALTTKEIHIKL